MAWRGVALSRLLTLRLSLLLLVVAAVDNPASTAANAVLLKANTRQAVTCYFVECS